MTNLRTIIGINVWTSKEGESRIYVKFDDNTQGCFYYSGNKYNKKGSLENLTDNEKKEAHEICKSYHDIKGWKSVKHYQLNTLNKKYLSNDEEDLDRESQNEFKVIRTDLGGDLM